MVATHLGDLSAGGVAESLVASARKEFGGLDQIVSNAGYADKRVFGDADAAALRLSLATVTEAFFSLATAALPTLRESQWGRVVAVSSFVAHNIGVNDTIFPVSAAAKAGLEALARTLAFQLAQSGVTVNCVSPGFTRKDPGAHAAVVGDAWQQAAAAAKFALEWQINGLSARARCGADYRAGPECGRRLESGVAPSRRNPPGAPENQNGIRRIVRTIILRFY